MGLLPPQAMGHATRTGTSGAKRRVMVLLRVALRRSICGETYATSSEPIEPRRSVPVVGDTTALRLVPARGNFGPYRFVELLPKAIVVRAHHVRPEIDHAKSAALDLFDEADDVVGLTLEHEQDRVVTEVRIRPVHQEKIRKAGNRDAEVGLGSPSPRFFQR